MGWGPVARNATRPGTLLRPGVPRAVVGQECQDLLAGPGRVGHLRWLLLKAEFRVGPECGKLSELPPKPEWGDKDADEHTSQQHEPEIDDPARDRHDQDEIEPGQPPPHDRTAVGSTSRPGCTRRVGRSRCRGRYPGGSRTRPGFPRSAARAGSSAAQRLAAQRRARRRADWRSARSRLDTARRHRPGMFRQHRDRCAARTSSGPPSRPPAVHPQARLLAHPCHLVHVRLLV
jgi:hypothetical protein